MDFFCMAIACTGRWPCYIQPWISQTSTTRRWLSHEIHDEGSTVAKPKLRLALLVLLAATTGCGGNGMRGPLRTVIPRIETKPLLAAGRDDAVLTISGSSPTAAGTLGETSGGPTGAESTGYGPSPEGDFEF